eukprot:6973935-Prorocentrum_lima.AAC.1
MEHKANQIHKMLGTHKGLMFYENSYDRVLEEEQFRYSEERRFPPLRHNQVSPPSLGISEDLM